MAANTQAVFPLTPNVNWKELTTATGTTDGTGSNVFAIFTAGANGSRVDQITAQASGTNVASVLWVWINNGGSVGTAANNTLYATASLPATTANTAAAISPVTISMNIALPATYKIYVAVGTTVAAGWSTTCQGGDY